MRKMIWVQVFIVAVFGMPSLGVLADEPAATEENKIPPVVARVNGQEITEKQYVSMWYTLQRARMRMNRSKAMDPKYMDAMKLETIDRLVVLTLLGQKADALNIQPDPKEVEDKIQEMKAMRMAGSFGGLLATMGAGQPEEDWDSQRADLVTSMKIQKLLEQEVRDKVNVTPAEVRAYYEDHPDEFRVSEEVCARHILIKVPADATDAQRREALRAINEAAERIKKGEAFKDVAKDVSQDGSASDGGNLGYFGRGAMVPEFEEVAYSLAEGRVSDVVETRFGYHLIKVDDKRPGSTISFDDIKAGIEQRLKNTKADARGREYIAGLKAEVEIEIISF
jgi:peptidyl-prolyl cis-trans isomerase C